MGAKAQTTQDFIEKAQSVHGCKYDYSETEYLNSRTKVAIKCRVHGVFYQQPTVHTFSKAGCQLCSGSGSRNTEQFIMLAREVHGDYYDYSEVDYTGNRERVKILCTVHGSFEQIAHIHLNKNPKHGCPACARAGRIVPRDILLERFRKTHGNLYSYEKVVPGPAADKVTITCELHGDFKVTSHNHEYGTGCPSCAFGGFRVTQPGTLYILKDESPVETTTKVGITGRAVETRTEEINRASGKRFVVVFTQDFEDGNLAAEVEKHTLAYLRDSYRPTQSVYNGSTESFVDVDLPKLLQIISALMTEKTTLLTT